MATPFDQLTKDRRLQEHWLRRLVAYIIDMVIIWVIIWIIAFAVTFGHMWYWYTGYFIFFTWSFISGIVVLLYTGILEGMRGTTIGKHLMKLKVVSRRSRMDIGKGLMRNVSKIFWVFLLIDILIALLTAGGPRQRFLDRIIDTTVEDVNIMPTYGQQRLVLNN